ncbi:hypothetical protein PCANC_27905 [Puccinia coronata f. sp. avenae]|uniref:Uncharacterized protein n=1 Tax=Puccinia coronata f. sp. avenae TaxID=200324 RepID=A0A2N5TIU8_9BASI|nr:hypothetical protein PCANC_27905 [Puccinia coronata f. sp. avenae]
MGAIKGKRFVVITDNTTTEGWVKNRKSKNKAANTELKEIQRLLIREDIDILGKRVSSGTNTANGLSRVADQQHCRHKDQARNTDVAGGTRLPADAEIDPSTFLAGLDPSLRVAVLLEQDDEFISTLPPNLLAQVDALRDCVLRRQHAVRSGRACDPLTGSSVTSASPITPASKNPPDKIDTVQSLQRHSLQKVLVNLCENSRSRAEKALAPVTPKSTTKLRRETHVGTLPHFPGESVQNLITLRCLEALSLLVTSNDLVPIYFLTEQEVPVALHKRSAKKSKDSGPLNEAGAAPAVSETATHQGAAQATVISEPSLSLAAANKFDAHPTTLEKVSVLAARSP